MNLPRTFIRKARSFARRCRAKWIARRIPACGPNQHPVFSIGIYTGNTPFNLKPTKNVANPVLAASDVSDVIADFVADPFILRDGQQWHMFLEVMNREKQRGQIAYAESKDGYQWQYRRIVLDEPFHLSYPHVFSYKGDHYMVPETYQAKAIRLYKALDFPFEWSLVKTLIDGEVFVDASPFFFRERWWLFASSGTEADWHSADLRLFHAAELTGPWIEHPQSPVVRNDRKVARPAGRVQLIDGRIFRLSQVCEPLYGMAVNLFEVTELTEEKYRERRVRRKPILIPGRSLWNAVGMHHLDVHKMDDGRWLACVDGWSWQDKPY